jgi:predicted house-cleaning noncanonical NTP pyrophosphatase (MazG superfamily)
MKIHNKLVRDRILEILEQEGVKYNSRILDDNEFKQELLKKIVEEAQEVLATGGDIKDLIKELADLGEVMEGVIKVFGLDRDEINKIKQDRHDQRGGFDKKIYLESTEE